MNEVHLFASLTEGFEFLVKQRILHQLAPFQNIIEKISFFYEQFGILAFSIQFKSTTTPQAPSTAETRPSLPIDDCTLLKLLKQLFAIKSVDNWYHLVEIMENVSLKKDTLETIKNYTTHQLFEKEDTRQNIEMGLLLFEKLNQAKIQYYRQSRKVTIVEGTVAMDPFYASDDEVCLSRQKHYMKMFPWIPLITFKIESQRHYRETLRKRQMLHKYLKEKEAQEQGSAATSTGESENSGKRKYLHHRDLPEVTTPLVSEEDKKKLYATMKKHAYQSPDLATNYSHGIGENLAFPVDLESADLKLLLDMVNDTMHVGIQLSPNEQCISDFHEAVHLNQVKQHKTRQGAPIIYKEPWELDSQWIPCTRWDYRIKYGSIKMKLSTAYNLVYYALQHHLQKKQIQLEPASSVSDSLTIFDCFCGTGTLNYEACAEPFMAQHIYQFVGNDRDITCIGPGMDSLQFYLDNAALFKASSATHPTVSLPVNSIRNKISFIQCDSMRLGLKSECVDIVVSDMPFGVRCSSHTKNRQTYKAIMQEAYRVAKKGATLAMLTLERALMEQIVKTLKNPQTGELCFKMVFMFDINMGGLFPTLHIIEKL